MRPRWFVYWTLSEFQFNVYIKTSSAVPESSTHHLNMNKVNDIRTTRYDVDVYNNLTPPLFCLCLPGYPAIFYTVQRWRTSPDFELLICEYRWSCWSFLIIRREDVNKIYIYQEQNLFPHGKIINNKKASVLYLYFSLQSERMIFFKVFPNLVWPSYTELLNTRSTYMHGGDQIKVISY
jgi:hypothetical protein